MYGTKQAGIYTYLGRYPERWRYYDCNKTRFQAGRNIKVVGRMH